jgi:hypothetical protein
MDILTTFFVCLWHTLLRNDFARDKSYNKFLSLEEQKQKRKSEKLRMQNVKSTLPMIKENSSNNVRRSLSDPPKETWNFRDPVPMVIVHLNQIVSGAKVVDNDTYLGSLFILCRTHEQVKATAEYYLTVFYECEVYAPCLVAWCCNRKLYIADQSTKEDKCALDVYVDIYAKPSSGAMEVLEVPYKTMQYIADTGNPKAHPELFTFCTNPIECHYTAKWYLRMYKHVQEEHEVNPEDTLREVMSNISFINGSGDKDDSAELNSANEMIEDVSSYVQRELPRRKLRLIRTANHELTTKQIMQQKRWGVNQLLNTSLGRIHKSISLSWNELAHMLQKGRNYSLPKCISTRKIIGEMLVELQLLIQQHKKLGEIAETNDSFLIEYQETLTLLWVLETWLKHQPFTDASTEPCPEEVDAPDLEY